MSDRLEQVAEKLRQRRPKHLEEAISRYERELPEADAVYSVSSVRERGWVRLQHNSEEYGHAMPWPKTARQFRMRPGEMTIWAGPNGSLKSMTTNFIMGHLAFHGVRAFVASLELTVDDQIARLARQMLCREYPTRPQFDELMDRLGENLTVYDFVGQVRPERMVALARYAASDLQAQHVLVDNLTMTVPPGRNSDEQAARFIAGLYQVGRDTGAHIHLIAHVRKPPDEGFLNRYDVRGTGAAVDQVDNVVLIQRGAENKKDDDADLYLTVDKQRHASWRGRIQFWIHETTARLMQTGADYPKGYL